MNIVFVIVRIFLHSAGHDGRRAIGRRAIGHATEVACYLHPVKGMPYILNAMLCYDAYVFGVFCDIAFFWASILNTLLYVNINININAYACISTIEFIFVDKNTCPVAMNTLYIWIYVVI